MPDTGCIMAVDPAARGCGIAVGVPGPNAVPHLETVKFSRDETDTTPIIFGRAAKYFLKIFDCPAAPAALVIETPVVVHNSTMMFGLFGIICGLAICHGVRVYPVTIATWRKYSLGAGHLNKRDAKDAALRLCRMLKWDAKDHDAAEAACIWLYGCALVKPASAATMKAVQFGPLGWHHQ